MRKNQKKNKNPRRIYKQPLRKNLKLSKKKKSKKKKIIGKNSKKIK